MKFILSYILVFITLSLTAQTRIEILSADELVYDREIGKYQRCIGNVRFKQDEVYMDCDSARFYEEVNKIEAFGNIFIRQKDTLNLWGDYLEYDGDRKLARLEKNVRMTDQKMRLETNQLEYDFNQKTAYYFFGGDIDNGEDHLYSRKGTYFSRSKEFFFKDEVKLTNPEYVMTSDTLRYNTLSKIAWFFGPTYIKSEENTIFCQYGWYDTERNISQFSKGAYIEGLENKLEADSMVYNRNTGYGEAFGNIRLSDTVEKVSIYGTYGNYQRLTKRTMITGNPMAIKEVEDDTLYLLSDTMVDQRDTLDKRILRAFHKVKVYKSDMQSISDSLEYNFADSTIKFYTDPILWTDSNQITGDTIFVFRNEHGLEKLKAFNNGFIIEKDQNAFFNQIAGKIIDGFFSDGKLNRVEVYGNGQSIYYALEDSTQYSGVNDIVCGSMIIYMDSLSKVHHITFKAKPKATFYPLEKFPKSKSQLQGFKWQADIRPQKSHFKIK